MCHYRIDFLYVIRLKVVCLFCHPKNAFFCQWNPELVITKWFCTLWEKITPKVSRFENFRNPENFNNWKNYLKIGEKSSFSLETNVAWFLNFHENVKTEVLNYFNWNVYKMIHIKLCFIKQKLIFLSFVSLSFALNNFEWSISLYLLNSGEFLHDILLESLPY